jgi:hypothetical protein
MEIIKTALEPRFDANRHSRRAAAVATLGATSTTTSRSGVPIDMRCERPTRHRTLRRAWFCLAAVALIGASVHAGAEYQWRDKSGQLHASDRPPPPDVPDKDILKRPSPNAAVPHSAVAAPAASAAASAASAPRGVDPELQARRARAEQENAERAKADEERAAALRAQNCSRARSQLALLDSGQRIARVNERGERVFLDDQARAEEAAAARRVIASDCR